MKKKMFLIINLILMITIPNIVLAFDPNISKPTPSIDAEVNTMVNDILGVIQWAGYAIAIGMLIYIGIKYMMSSANEKADVKKAAINYAIGAVVIAGAVTICTWCIQIFNDEGGNVNPGAGPGNGAGAVVPIIGGGSVSN